MFNSSRRLQFSFLQRFLLEHLVSGIAGIFGAAVVPETDASVRFMLRRLQLQPGTASVVHAEAKLRAIAGAVDSQGAAPALVWNARRDVGCFLSGQPFDGELTADVPATLIASYEKCGIDALVSLHGWFSGVLIDLRQQRAILFNDRYGLGRVYLYKSSGRTFFSSEAKSLLGLFPQTRRLDPQGLAEWLSCGCVLQNRTLFSGITLLPPGSAWSFTPDGNVTQNCYFDPHSWESRAVLAPGDYQRQLAEVFPRALQRSLRGTAPIAMSLTGGLDGRMIMSWARSAPGALPCYTFNGPHRDCADVRIARHVAEVCGQSHRDIPIEADFFGRFPGLAEESVFLTDGAMDVTGAAELYVNRRARVIAPVRLTGNYGSEIIRRHVAFRPRGLAAGLFTSELMNEAHRAAATYRAEANGNPLSFIAFKQVPWHHFARFAVERSQLDVRSPFLDHELVALSFQAPPESATQLEPSLRLIAEGNSALARIPTDRGVSWPSSNGWLNQLRHRFHDYVAKAEYAYDYGMPDWLARADRSVSRLHLERMFLGRQKFCHFRSWYRGPLSKYVKEILLDPAASGRSYLQPGAAEKAVQVHMSADGNRTVELHKLLTLELIHRTLLRAPQDVPTISGGSESTTVTTTESLVH